MQDRLAAGASKEAIARELGMSKVTLYAWLEQLQSEMQRTVATRKIDYAERLTERQFNLYDELARMATLLQTEVALLGQAQRALRTEPMAASRCGGLNLGQEHQEKMRTR